METEIAEHVGLHGQRERCKAAHFGKLDESNKGSPKSIYFARD